ncbi:MAG: hypothetical protein RLZZ59_28 [Pseudomonadota bacterium]|jgi:flagellar basal-body rod protein FlgB
MFLRIGILYIFVLGLMQSAIASGDKTTQELIKQVDYLQNRHSVLAENIANVSTPKYITKDIEKPDAIQKNGKKLRVKRVRMALTNSHHMLGKQKDERYNTILDKSSPMKPNKNNVDLSSQVTKLAQNSDETTQALKNYRSAIDMIGIASGNSGGSQ